MLSYHFRAQWKVPRRPLRDLIMRLGSGGERLLAAEQRATATLELTAHPPKRDRDVFLLRTPLRLSFPQSGPGSWM